MEDKNTKKLTIILIIILIIILSIVLISLLSYFSKTDIFGYHNYRNNSTTTTKVIDKTYNEASPEEKKYYNELLLTNNYLLPLNTIIKNNSEIYNINLLQSDESKFIYIYAKLNKESLTINEINNEIKNIFNYQIDNKYISKYLNENTYSYELDDTKQYCFKLNNIKEENNSYYLNIDIINYNEEKCSQDELNYDSIKEGLLVISKNDDKYIINSFALIKKEG